MNKNSTFRNVTVFFYSLPKSKPVVSYLLNKGIQLKGKKFHLCFVFLCVLPVRYLARGQHKSLSLSIRSQLTQSCAPMDKTHGLSVLCSSSLQYCLKMSSRKTDLDHLSVVCNDLSMMVYHIVTSVSGYVHVSYSEKLYRCPHILVF